LSPRLFKKNITKSGISFTKKPSAKLSHLSYACPQSRRPWILESAAQRSRATCEAEDEKLEMEQRRRNGLVANLASASRPRTDVIETLVGLGSPASTVSAANVAESKEQARCADAGLDAVTSAWAGAVTNVTGAPSGVASNDAAGMALAVLSGRRVDAEKRSAKRLRDAAVGLEAPQGSRRLYVVFLFRSIMPHIVFTSFSLFPILPSLRYLVLTRSILLHQCSFFLRLFPLACACRSQRISDGTPVVLLDDAGTPGATGPFGPPRLAPSQVAGSLTEWVFADETGSERAEFLSLVEAAATELGIRGSTLGGSADVEELVTHLFSHFAATNKALGCDKASCRDWTASLRPAQR